MFERSATHLPDRMHALLEHDYQWRWPDNSHHLANWVDDPSKCAKKSEEDTTTYAERDSRRNFVREFITNEQAQWLRCAVITSRALEYLQACRRQKLILQGLSPSGQDYSFEPRLFYQYIWICLNQGTGTRLWKSAPLMFLIPETESDSGDLVVLTAQRLLEVTIRNWEQGMDLGSIFPTLSLDDVLPLPHDAEPQINDQGLNKAISN
ncbi:hypothetical protein BKA67DRAFT_519594 [Truncatella angustata]|uniref:Uncharacterized protein n=1 Tax=Truncatella angustata TaxID=152316 RepID=A0A9P8UJY6_9PEZI|nr:uncharacterized protein BKA67DRAFT_519594 [Truncatella angustata]KAH6653375.1 hypothetical protein BKA67DRAFT_519594 [Truncatella angustata]